MVKSFALRVIHDILVDTNSDDRRDIADDRGETLQMTEEKHCR